MRNTSSLVFCAALFVLLVAAGCSSSGMEPPGSTTMSGAGQGEKCAAGTDCQAGLECEHGICVMDDDAADADEDAGAANDDRRPDAGHHDDGAEDAGMGGEDHHHDGEHPDA